MPQVTARMWSAALAKTTRTQRPRGQGYRRRDAAPAAAAPLASPGPGDAGPTPAPRVTAPAQRAATPVSTRITTTDYGYVAGEVRRIALLTLVLIVVLFGFWLVLG